MSRTVAVEPHPASAIFPPEFKRWRVLLDGMQHSVHETEEEADAAAKTLRKVAVNDGWDSPQVAKSRPGQDRDDWG